MGNESVIEEETNSRKNDELILYKLDELKAGNKKQDETTNKILVLLTGNGKPENGLIVKHHKLVERVKSNTDVLSKHWRMLSAIAIGVFGTIFGVLFKIVYTIIK